jgi:hypothetical protein
MQLLFETRKFEKVAVILDIVHRFYLFHKQGLWKPDLFPSSNAREDRLLLTGVRYDELVSITGLVIQ